jgi:hypothetical protein
MKNVYLRLDAKGFAALVKGEAVELSSNDTTVHLILADIGYPLMRQLMEAQIVIREPSELPEPCIIPPGEPLRP